MIGRRLLSRWRGRRRRASVPALQALGGVLTLAADRLATERRVSPNSALVDEMVFDKILGELRELGVSARRSRRMAREMTDCGDPYGALVAMRERLGAVSR